MSDWSSDQRIANHAPDRELVAPATRSTRPLNVSGFRRLPNDFMTIPTQLEVFATRSFVHKVGFFTN
jgi:hypothetical protein